MLKFFGKALKVTLFSLLLTVVGILAFLYFSDDYSAYVVLSDSMKPNISSGDMVFTGKPNRPLVGDIAPGTIITFERNNGLVTHRVDSIEGDTVITRGDALESADPWSVSRYFDVKGCYIFHIPHVGLMSSFIKTKTGWFVSVILPAMFLVSWIIKDIVKEAFSSA